MTDLILTKKPNFFLSITETVVSDYHKLAGTFFKSHFYRLSPKALYYRNLDHSSIIRINKKFVNLTFPLW